MKNDVDQMAAHAKAAGSSFSERCQVGRYFSSKQLNSVRWHELIQNFPITCSLKHWPVNYSSTIFKLNITQVKR